MDLIEKIEKYNLTLRHVPDFEVSFHIAREKELDPNNLKENQEHVIWDNWKDGIARTMVKTSRPRKFSPWLCMQDKSFGNLQNWSGAFFGDTAEEAVNKAIESIENKKR